MAWKILKENHPISSKLLEHEALKELDGVQELVDWSRFERLLKDIHSSRKGERAWPPLMMFKALLLQSWYQLSDPALEKQLVRDLLFRRFVGLPLSESVPDHSSLWRFRKKLEGELMGTLLIELNEQLAEQGLYIKEGAVSIIDASVIEAKQCRPNKNKQGKPTQDTEAGWNVKKASNGKKTSTYGFKAHINVDEDGFIKTTDFTAGNVHDSLNFIDLLEGDESAAYADSAYQSKKHREYLEEKNIKDCLTRRAYRNKPLTKEDKQFNRINSGTRSIVERVFGVLKQHYGMAKARYLGKIRNQTRFELMCVAHNLKRGVSIQQESCV